MKTVTLILLNVGLLVLFVGLFRKQSLLSYHQRGRVWLTWLAIAIITLMDEFTSIFYVPAKAYRFIGPSAIYFIVLTSLLIRFLSTRFTEIAEILEHHDLIGGGVYFFFPPAGPVRAVEAFPGSENFLGHRGAQYSRDSRKRPVHLPHIYRRRVCHVEPGSLGGFRRRPTLKAFSLQPCGQSPH
jgi:hypothetical protein